MNKFKHVIWDWNGTLLDDVDACIESMNNIMRKRDLGSMDKNKYMSVFNFPVKDYYTTLGFDFTKEPFESVSDDFTEQYEKRCFSCSLHKEATKILAAIHDRHITQSILTAAHQDYIEKCVKFYNIDKYFMRILGLDNTHAHGKVDNGRRLISELPYEASEVVMIGDTEHDYEVAKEIGCQSILISCGHHTEERLKKKNAIVLSRLNQVLEYII